MNLISKQYKPSAQNLDYTAVYPSKRITHMSFASYSQNQKEILVFLKDHRSASRVMEYLEGSIIMLLDLGISLCACIMQKMNKPHV